MAMLGLVLASTLCGGLPTQAPDGHSWWSQLGYPWLGFSYGVGVRVPPLISIRAHAGVRTAWDILELGGELALGGSPVDAHVGGLGYLKFSPYPVGLGRIFYVRGGVGRLHFVNAVYRRHASTIEAMLGFRIPTERPIAKAGAFVYIEAGVDHRRICQDWAMPCTAGRSHWWPAFAVGATFF